MENCIVRHGLASSWPSCLGRFGLGWRPTVKTEEVGEPWLLAHRRRRAGQSDDLPVARSAGHGG
jgi:hypothetical protein